MSYKWAKDILICTPAASNVNRQIKIFHHCLLKHTQTTAFFGIFHTERSEKQYDFACLFSNQT